MNDLEEALLQDNEYIDSYLSDVSPKQIRADIQQMLLKAQSPDIAVWKQKLKDYIDTL